MDSQHVRFRKWGPSLVCLTLGCLGLVVSGCESGSGVSNTTRSGRGKPPSSSAPSSARSAPPSRAPVTAESYSEVSAAIGALRKAASGGDQDERLRAEEWLQMQGSSAIEPLAAELLDEDADLALRIAVCRPLRALGPDARPAFLAAIQSPRRLVRLNALKGLAMIRPPEKATVEVLLGMVDHEDLQTQRIAILSLGLMGRSAESAVPRLLKILNGDEASETLRTEAKRALRKVNPRRTLQD